MARPHSEKSSSQTADLESLNTEKTQAKFKGNFKFMPPKNKNMFIETFCRLVENDVSHLCKNIKKEYKVQNNLPLGERKALEELMEDTSITVKPCDKGGGIYS